MPPSFRTSVDRQSNANWCKLILSALVPCILGIFTIVFSIQQQSLSKKEHEINQQNQRDAQQQTLFDVYINDISKLLLYTADTNRTSERKLLLYMRTKTLTVLRNLNSERKAHVILFLYESGFLQGPRLDLSGADLNDVQFISPYQLDRLHLPNVFWRNALFVDCSLIEAVFSQSHMPDSRFINSSLEAASLPEALLDNAHFIQTSVLSINFTSASLIRANFVDAKLVQDIDFSNADLYQAQFTENQFRGRRVHTLPHSFRHSRLPNGSIGVVNSARNLIQNGDAEMECSTGGNSHWQPNYIAIASSLIHRNEKSLNNTAIGRQPWGNCTFVLSMRNARVSQYIHLQLYTRLIDLDGAAFSASAFVGCNASTNASYIEVSTHGSDGNIMEMPIYLNRTSNDSTGDGIMHSYSIQGHRLLPYTPRVRVSFGVRQALQTGIHCYFDSITFSMHKR